MNSQINPTLSVASKPTTIREKMRSLLLANMPNEPEIDSLALNLSYSGSINAIKAVAAELEDLAKVSFAEPELYMLESVEEFYVLAENKQIIFNKVAKILVQQDSSLKFADITLSSNLKSDLGLDSLLIVEFAQKVEEQFDIYITSKEMETMSFVSDVIKCVERWTGLNILGLCIELFKKATGTKKDLPTTGIMATSMGSLGLTNSRRQAFLHKLEDVFEIKLGLHELNPQDTLLTLAQKIKHLT